MNKWVQMICLKKGERTESNGTYQKNYENIYDLVNTYDGVNNALRNAKRRMAEFNADRDMPSKFDPGTTVYKLVEDLTSYLEE